MCRQFLWIAQQSSGLMYTEHFFRIANLCWLIIFAPSVVVIHFLFLLCRLAQYTERTLMYCGRIVHKYCCLSCMFTSSRKYDFQQHHPTCYEDLRVKLPNNTDTSEGRKYTFTCPVCAASKRLFGSRLHGLFDYYVVTFEKNILHNQLATASVHK